jgi:F-box protein 11
MSYAHVDNKTGRLTEFCQRLSDEVHQLMGEPFPIFQDKTDIHWGQSWRDRIDESLDSATFLIPILTPSFFKSPECRKELEQFLERERKLGRKDLILPVYYIDCPVLNDEKKRGQDPLAKAIHARQRADWRDLRHEPFTSPIITQKLEWLGKQVLAALERVAAPSELIQPDLKFSPVADAQSTSTKTAGVTQAGLKQAQTATRNEPQELVVDPLHRGDYASISEAIKAAKPGARILVRAGLYEEGLVIDKPLEIIGQGAHGEVEVRISGQNAILFKTTFGRVTNLKLRQTGGKHYCVAIAQGRLDLEDCDISSQSLACIAIHGEADPRLRRNRIHDGKDVGVLVYERGRGTLEDNDIFANALAGVSIKNEGDPILRRNRIHDGKKSGVYVHAQGRGTLEDNDIFANALAGVSINSAGDPILRRNSIRDGKQSGVFVYEKGRGMLEDNDIFANALAGVEISEEGDPTLRSNRIRDNKQAGVHIYSQGRGTLEDNDISANARAGISIRTESDPILRHNRINKNGYEAIWVFDGGGGRFEENDLRENARGAWNISEDSNAKVNRARNLE